MDDLTKNHGKMRSEEAKPKFKSLKAIDLEPGKPSMKSQIKALAADEVGGSHRFGLMSISATAKGKRSSRRAANMSKSLYDVVPSRMADKQDTNTVFEKEIPTRASKENNGSKPIDLQRMLISLLKDNPNGMTLEALEKVVSNVRPSFIQDLEPTIKRIAKYIPGRYILKPEVDSESFKKPTESGSFLKIKSCTTSAPQGGGFKEEVPNDDLEETMQVKSKVKEETLEKIDMKHASHVYQQLKKRKSYIGSLFDERESEVIDSSRNEQSDRLSKGKHKMGSEWTNIDDKSEGAKRLKAGHLTRESYSPHTDVQMFGNSRNFSPFEFTEDTGRADRQRNCNLGFQKGYSRALPGKSSSDLQKTGQRSFDQRPLGNPSYPIEKSDKLGESIRHNRKHTGKDFRAHVVSFVPENKSHKDAQNEDIYVTEKKVPRNSRDGSNGSKQSLLSVDSNYQKHGEMVGKLKEGRQGTQSHLGKSSKDNNRIGLNKSSAVNGRGISLTGELSDLDYGELRESTPEETIVAKQFERKGSFKHIGIEANTSEVMNSNITEVKPLLKPTLDYGRPTLVLSSGFPSNLDNTNEKNVDNHFEDSTKSRCRVTQTHSHHLKADSTNVGSQFFLPEMSTKFRNSESGVSRGIDLDGCRDTNRRVPANRSKQDTKHGMVPYPVKESKIQTPNSCEEVPDGRKDAVFADRNNGDQKKKELSTDENSCSYSKFEKEEPELKGPITTFSEYTEYVQEYQDKYESYISLHKILKEYRVEFQKLGDDLESAKSKGDMDRYNDIATQIRESYRQCGSRQNRLKKIFIVLHEEMVNTKQRIRDFVQSNKD
ncbi:uncharacterized protein [Medicago truncatula]|uniref:uncharacterized protein isoform X2 n=2 Tax=Medicago truncatula TaxID=3880 RepID=UPI000D2F474D|nr:uncharacterized protein LOC25500395 isoform X2 [Medicago truncatula]